MVVTNISTAKAHFSELVERVLHGEEIIIGKAGYPVAKLIPFVKKDVRRKPGALKGKIRISDDFETLPDDIAAAFGIVAQ